MKLPRYPEYRDSGVDWLGDVPAHWEVKRLRFLAATNPLASRHSGVEPDDLVSFVPMDAVGEYGGLRLDIEREFGEVDSGYTYFANDDVVLAKITPCFENGKGALAVGLSNGMAFGTTELHVLRAKPVMDPRFLFYLSIAHPFRKIGESWMYGAGGQKRVPEEFVKDFRTPQPPLEEQRTISFFLDHKTERIDALIGAKRQTLEKLSEKRAALISRSVTRGLNENVPFVSSGIDWLGDVPAHWGIDRLKWSVHSLTNGVWGTEADGGDDDLACIRVADFDRVSMRVDTSDLTMRAISHSERKSRLLDAGDLLIEKSGGGPQQPVGAVVRFDDDVDAVTSNFIARLIVADGYDSRFLTYLHAHLYARRVNVRSIKQATGIQNLDSRSYFDECVGIPSIDEQSAIADFLDRKLERINFLVQRTRRAIDQLSEYRTSLVTHAVTGKFDTRIVS